MAIAYESLCIMCIMYQADNITSELDCVISVISKRDQQNKSESKDSYL